MPQKQGVSSSVNRNRGSISPLSSLTLGNRTSPLSTRQITSRPRKPKIYNGGDWSKTAAELYDYAARMATFDIDGVREYAGSNVTANHFKTTLFKQADGYYQVSYGSCPSTAGFNIVPLNIPDEEGAVVTADFRGLKVGSDLPEGDAGNFINGDLQTIQLFLQGCLFLCNGGQRGLLGKIDTA